MSGWKYQCCRCPRADTDLGAMYEHAGAAHGITWEQLHRHQIRSYVEETGEWIHAIDDDPWLLATPQ